MIPETSQISLEGIPLDLIALGVLTVALFLFGVTGGRRFSLSFLLALYLAEGAVAVLPSFRSFLLRFAMRLPQATPPIVFLVSLAIATWFLAGSAVTAIFRFSGKGFRAVSHVVIATVLSVGVFTVFFFPMLPKGTADVSPIIAQWFLRGPYPLLWILASFVFFAFVRVREE